MVKVSYAVDVGTSFVVKSSLSQNLRRKYDAKPILEVFCAVDVEVRPVVKSYLFVYVVNSH